MTRRPILAFALAQKQKPADVDERGWTGDDRNALLGVGCLVWVLLVGYIATIFGANWAIQTFGLVPVGFGLMAPAGVYFIGLAFTLRDFAQERVGKVGILCAVLIGAALSYLVSPAFAVASGAAFLCSELIDFAIYTPLRQRRWWLAVGLSNLAGLVIDSALFLFLAFGSLDFLAGQVVGKLEMTVLAIVFLAVIRALSIRRRDGRDDLAATA